MITKKKIGVLAGGTSAERDVSLRSGAAVFHALKERGYNVHHIDPDRTVAETLVREKIDAAFIALHGGHGENGALQGMLEVMEIPYTGSGILASALAMDKEASKVLFREHHLPVAQYVLVKQKTSDMPAVPFALPWVVKPVAQGSSIGVTIVKDAGGVQAAMREAFRYGTTIIIEQYIRGKEIQIGILGSRMLGGVEVRPSREFYDYEAKYKSEKTNYILPPELVAVVYERACETGLKAHQALGCCGATRVDLIVAEDGTPFVLEVNTVPGLTETSLLPKIAGLAGLSFGDLVEEMLRLALEKTTA
ncbi:MAG TPA: D-alanine--D-alanine ligase [Dissulfurispiraceae bacterium]|nr:D-alanine--D-alanine ligase [Dissulfurispiraceae bacterium]